MSQQPSGTTQNPSEPVRNGMSNGLSNGLSNGTTNGQASASGNQGTTRPVVFAAAIVRDVNEHGQPLRVRFLHGDVIMEVPGRFARTLSRAVRRDHGAIVTAIVSGETLVRWLDVEIDGGYDDQASPTGDQGTGRQTVRAAAFVTAVDEHGAIEQVRLVNGDTLVDISPDVPLYVSGPFNEFNNVIVTLIKNQDGSEVTAAGVHANARVSG